MIKIDVVDYEKNVILTFSSYPLIKNTARLVLKYRQTPNLVKIMYTAQTADIIIEPLFWPKETSNQYFFILSIFEKIKIN